MAKLKILYKGKELKTFYLSGKIADCRDYIGRFNVAEDAIRRRQFEVINPADLPKGFSKSEYMRFAFASIWMILSRSQN